MPDKTATLSELAIWLADAKRPANTLTLEQLYGFLFAICSTPTELIHSDWMPAIFADQLRDVPQADEYLNSII